MRVADWSVDFQWRNWPPEEGSLFRISEGYDGRGQGRGGAERNALLDKASTGGHHAEHDRLVIAPCGRIKKSHLPAFKSRKPEITKTRNATWQFSEFRAIDFS